MKNVILIDDEPEMIRSLANNVAWEDYGYRVGGVFINVDQALSHMMGHRVDVAFVDISMPGKTGFDFIAQARKINPYIVTIVLTCHNEFDYAKTALDQKVDEYLVKQTLTEEDVVHTLQKLRDPQKESASTTHRYVLIDQYFEQMIDGKLTTKELEQLELKLIDTRYTELPKILIALYFLDPQYMYFDLEKHRLSILNLLSVDQKVYCFIYSNRLYLYVDNNQHNCADASAVLHEMIDQLSDYFTANKMIAFSQVFYEKQFVLQDVVKNLCDVNQFFYSSGGCHFSYQKNNPWGNAQNLPSQVTVLTSFRNLINAKDFLGLSQYLKDWRAQILNTKPNPQYVIETYQKLFLSVEYLFLNLQQSYSIDYKMLLMFYQYDQLLQKVIEDYREKCLAEVKTETACEEIENAIEYIENHLFDDFGRDDVAKVVHLNPSYFSRLFKKSLDVSFSEYVLNRRLIRAKEMLSGTTLSVLEICFQLKFKDTSYFYKAFKKKYHVLPTEFRKNKAHSSLKDHFDSIEP